MSFLLLPLIAFGQQASEENIQVRVNRWLEVSQLSGLVTIQSRTGPLQTAQVGSRLQAIGDMLSTDVSSEATLAVDTTVGFIDIAEQTSIAIIELRSVSDGGRVTKLEVSRGQARLRVRPFTHGSSELEIETPAGWSGVRGTEFGVTVHPDGKTGVATLEGAVVTSGQGETVDVDAGFQTLVVPGEVPLPPVPLEGMGDTRLRPRIITAISEDVALVEGSVDSVNLLIVNDEVQEITPDGVFSLQVPIPDNRLIRARVITPLGAQQAYDLAIP
ncbi:MAG: FecR family protein [Leptolyngbyaceae bacterium]|nr:FecR family protein [Leptolyngbyaceae bacterium]